MVTLIRKQTGRSLSCAVLVLLAGAGAAFGQHAPPARSCAPSEAPRRYDPNLSVSLNRIDDYDRRPAITMSDDGRWAAWVTHCGDAARNRNIHTLWVYDLAAVRRALRGEGPAPGPAFTLSREAGGSDPGISELQWSAGNRRLAFVSRSRPSGATLEMLDLASGKTAVLVDSPHRILAYRQVPAGTVYARAVPPAEAGPVPDPRGNGYVPQEILPLRYLGLLRPGSDARSGAAEIWLSPPAGPPRRLVSIPETIDFTFPGISFSPDGHFAVVAIPPRAPTPEWRRYRVSAANLQAMLDTGRGTQLHLFDLETGTVRPLIDAPAAGVLGNSLIYNSAVWAADGKSVILRSNGLPLSGASAAEIQQRIHHSYVVEVDVPSLRFRPIARLPGRTLDSTSKAERPPRAIYVTRGGTEVSFERRLMSGPIGVARFRKEAGAWKASNDSALPAGETDPSFSLKVSQDYDHPPRVVASQHETGRALEIQDLNPVLRSLDIGRVAVFEWKDLRGRSWKGGLVYPPGALPGRPLPLVIQFYGFAPNEFLADGPHTTAFAARSLAARNMLVLQVPQVLEWGVPDEGPSNLDMVLGAIDALAAQGLADKSRVGLVAFSTTCYPLKYAIANAPDAFRAAVAADGRDMGHFEYVLSYSDRPDAVSLTAYFDKMFGGSPYTEQGQKSWRELSPIFKASQIRAALLDQSILRGGVVYAWEMHSALRRNHVPSQIINFPEGRHELELPAERVLSMQATVDWMSFWLLDMDNLPTVPPATLAHWRAMRDEQRHYHEQRPRR